MTHRDPRPCRTCPVELPNVVVTVAADGTLTATVDGVLHPQPPDRRPYEERSFSVRAVHRHRADRHKLARVPAEVWHQVQSVLIAHQCAVEATQVRAHYLKGTIHCG